MERMTNLPELHSEKFRRGPWLEEEDKQLTMVVARMGQKKWDLIAKASGLERSGKSCRFRWLNYLRPNLKHGCISSEEEQIILQLHRKWGNKWSKIARSLPGRTDNEIKNYWRCHLRKKLPIQREGEWSSSLKEFPASLGRIPMHGHEHQRKIERKDVSSSNSFDDHHGFSKFEITSSPYEIRLWDWMDQLKDEHEQVYHYEEYCNGSEFCLCYPNMKFTEFDDQTDYLWDSLASIWDMA